MTKSPIPSFFLPNLFISFLLVSLTVLVLFILSHLDRTSSPPRLQNVSSWDTLDFRRVIVVIPLTLIVIFSPLMSPLRTLHSSHPLNLFPFLKYSLPYISPLSDALSHHLQVYHRRHRVVAPPLSSAEVPDDSLLVPLISSTPTLSSTDHLPIALLKGNRSTRNPHSIYNFLSYHPLSSSYYAFVSTLSSISLPKSTSEALSHLGWRQTTVDEMVVLHSNGT